MLAFRTMDKRVANFTEPCTQMQAYILASN